MRVARISRTPKDLILFEWSVRKEKLKQRGREEREEEGEKRERRRPKERDRLSSARILEELLRGLGAYIDATF
ncbi:hypothetical protein Scep_021266 [Stephania cephalantha]|uniref:Uncharacterized protein n=1 Tax=Stephania cephalantha TaxID=152367 RepID=A0AAP0F5T9_9MAGN